MTGTDAQRQAAQAAIHNFDFDDYGLDDVSIGLHDRPGDQEWVPVLAAQVTDAVLDAARHPAPPQTLSDAVYDVLMPTVAEHRLIHCATTGQYPPANVHGIESGEVHDLAERIARAVQALKPVGGAG